MKKLDSITLKVCLGLFCLSLFNACTTTYYATGTQPVLNLAKKGDLNLSISTSTNYNGNANIFPLDASVSYSPVSNLGLFAGTVGFSDDFGTRFSKERFSEGRSYVIGIGHYTMSSDLWRIQTYGFANFGKYNIIEFDVLNFTSNFNKFGIQESIAFSVSRDRRNNLNISTSLAVLNYNNIHCLSDKCFRNLNHAKYLNDNSQNLLWESALTYTFSSKLFNIFHQLGISQNFSNHDFLQQNGVAAFGIQMDIAEIASRLNKKKSRNLRF